MSASKYSMEHIDAMDGHEFEHFIADLLRRLGYENVEVTRGSGDQGVDVLAEKEGVRYAVQCKCYSSDLGNTPVQEVNTGKVIYHCHVGVVVTNRYFTQGAKEAARATGVLLWNRDKLQDLLTQAELIAEVSSDKNPLVKRGMMALDDGEWEKADIFFERALDQDPECAEAYWGKTLSYLRMSSASELNNIFVNLDSIPDFKYAIRFSEEEQLRKLQAIYDSTQKRRLISCLSGIIATYARRKEDEISLKHFFKLAKKATPIISASPGHILGLKTDGTVVAVGNNYSGQCNVSSWTDITSVVAGGIHSVGLKTDGTVVAVGDNDDGQCNVSNWTDITSVAAGISYSVGLKSDGTVIAVGSNYNGQCNVDDWNDIVAIGAISYHTVGLKKDGTVVAVGDNDHGQCNVDNWRDIVSIYIADDHTVGLKSDGTLVATNKNWSLRYNMFNWKDLVAVTGCGSTVGLKSDGTVVATDDELSALVSSWKLFDNFETLEQEQIEARALKKAEIETEHHRQIEQAEAEHNRQEEEHAREEAEHSQQSKETETEYRSQEYSGVQQETDKKPSKEQEPDEMYKQDILTYLSANPGLAVTTNDIMIKVLMAKYPTVLWSLQKTADLLNALCDKEDKIARVPGKGRRAAVYMMITEEEHHRQEEEQAKKKAALESEQATLQIELANLKGLFKGLFAGWRRKEIEAKLVEIEQELKKYNTYGEARDEK